MEPAIGMQLPLHLLGMIGLAQAVYAGWRRHRRLALAGLAVMATSSTILMGFGDVVRTGLRPGPEMLLVTVPAAVLAGLGWRLVRGSPASRALALDADEAAEREWEVR